MCNKYFEDKKFRGAVGVRAYGGHTNLFLFVSPLCSSVFGAAGRSDKNHFGGRRQA